MKRVFLNKEGQKRFSNWKEKQEIKYINSNDIIITEEIHQNCEVIGLNRSMRKLYNVDKLDGIIIVRQYKDGYTLVMGIKNLIIAKLLGKEIACIEVSKNTTHNKFINQMNYITPTGTEGILKMSDIRITKSFKKTNPKQEKINKYKEYYNEHKCLDKPITVRIEKINGKVSYVLKDGYIRYLIYKELGIKNIPVKFVQK